MSASIKRAHPKTNIRRERFSATSAVCSFGNSAMRAEFTLIEMLVVIAIIGILAAMLMPSLRSALDNARASTCRNQLRQLGIAFNMYFSDNNGRTPRPTEPAPTWEGYDEKIRPYLQIDPSLNLRHSDSLFTCPVAVGLFGITNRITIGKNTRDPDNANKVKKPSFTVLAGDGSPNPGFTDWYKHISETAKPWTAHTKGANLIFFDLHAEWVLAADIPSAGDPGEATFWKGQ